MSHIIEKRLVNTIVGATCDICGTECEEWFTLSRDDKFGDDYQGYFYLKDEIERYLTFCKKCITPILKKAKVEDE